MAVWAVAVAVEQRLLQVVAVVVAVVVVVVVAVAVVVAVVVAVWVEHVMFTQAHLQQSVWSQPM
jgi:hypothetical protein